MAPLEFRPPGVASAAPGFGGVDTNMCVFSVMHRIVFEDMAKKPNIKQLKEGDEYAWLWFYEEFYAPVYRYVTAKGVADSENVTGNVMEAVAKSIMKFNGSLKSLRSWVFSIAHNHIVDQYRRQARRPETLQEDPALFLGESDEYFEFDFSPDIKHSIAKFSLETREMLMLKFVCGMSAKEIAVHLNRSHSSVRVSIHRALKDIKEDLETREVKYS